MRRIYHLFEHILRLILITINTTQLDRCWEQFYRDIRKEPVYKKKLVFNNFNRLKWNKQNFLPLLISLIRITLRKINKEFFKTWIPVCKCRSYNNSNSTIKFCSNKLVIIVVCKITNNLFCFNRNNRLRLITEFFTGEIFKQ